MSKRIYVGNLPFDTTERDVERLFSDYRPIKVERLKAEGQHQTAIISVSRGAEEIIQTFDGKSVGNTAITVSPFGRG